MPLHDWSRVDAGTFHAFHTGWNWELQEALNAGRLPPDFYSMVEQHAVKSGEDAVRWVADLLTLHAGVPSEAGPSPPSPGGLALTEAPPKVSHHLTLEPSYRLQRRTLAIRHVSGHRLVAVVEMVSPANKDRPGNVERLVSKIAAFLDAGIHVLLIDLFLPGPYDPRGIHGALGRWFDDVGSTYQPSLHEPLTLASYRAVASPDAYVEHLAVGQSLPDMPLFFAPERYVDVPLQLTYDTAFAAMPQFWRDVLTRPAAGGNGSMSD